MFETKLRKIGNSLGLIIPSSIVKSMDLEDEEILNARFDPTSKQLIITKKEASLYDTEEFQNAVRDAVEKALQNRDNKINGKG